ncbi:MAG: F0F1 ATP synthase subunit alpha, partial [Clostridia bacterium]|nr:F0F1 ATP synthase subunit alpha [Clostridia bacterium]
ITDGQIFLESELFHEGQRPAVNVGLSVSRVGGAAQTKLMKQVSASLRTKLAQYRELAEFTQFGTDVDDTTKKTLDAGQRLTEALKQDRLAPLDDWQQVLILYAVSNGFADAMPVNRLSDFEKDLFAEFSDNHTDLVDRLKTGNKITPDFAEVLGSAITAVAEKY